MNASQRGTVIAGVWLISLGAVFLVQQALDVPWGRAWPLFLVMAGVGTGVSAIVGLGGRRAAPWTLVWALIWPAILIVAGVVLFLDLAGLADIDAFALLARWWPLLLIGVGVLILVGSVWPRGRGVEDRLSIASGGVAAGEVTLKFGAGRLEVGRGSAGVLVEGTFEGGVVRRELGPGQVELAADPSAVWPWFGDQLSWRLGLAPDIPLALRLEGGASRNLLDLTDLNVTSLSVKTGASDTRIELPAAVERCDVRVEAGAAQVTIHVPPSVAAQISSKMGLGNTTVDERRFPRAFDGWASPDFATAERRVKIRVTGGVGSVRVS